MVRLVKILLAESPQVAGFIIHNLRDHGHIVDATSDGDTAVAIALTDHYDAILLGVALPRGNGVEVAAGLRRAGLSIPILLLTSGDHNAERLVRVAGADGYLAKPFRFEVLLERVRYWEAQSR
jgi:DNA-binding response OmpR family regulator